jgi:xanthosine utilization system XapX-like protein
MVSIENRISYMERVNESFKLNAFHYFLLGKEVSSLSSKVSDLDHQFYEILFSIQTNNKTAFQEIYAKKSKSNPSKESPAPFVNDDYLIFCLIIAIDKFSIDKTWMKNIISIRNRNAITITFENILNENYLSTSNQIDVVLIFLNLCNQSKINNNLLNAAYKSITENTTLLENRNDFQILCAFRAYDLVIEQKEVCEGNEITLLKNFNQKFKTRIKILSLLLQAGFVLGLIYSLFKLPIYSPETIELINKYNFVFSIIGVIGFTLIGNQIPFIRNKTLEYLMKLFGYPKELIKSNK